jgi:hypothetical protein
VPLLGVSSINDKLLTEALVENVKEYFDWNLLEVGGFGNVGLTPLVDVTSTSEDKLHMIHSQGLVDGRAWETNRSNWVWETGVPGDTPPINSSGVYVNGTFYPTATTTGQYKHYVNFPEGRVVFDAPIAPTSIVQAEYAYRWATFYDQSVPWFKDVVFDAFLIDQQPMGSGFVNLLNDNDIRLPAVIVEPVMRREQEGYQLGSRAKWVRQDVLFHIIAERSVDRNNLMDAITLQKDNSFALYDVNARRRANDFALDWRGSPRSGATMYPGLIDAYRWNTCTFTRMEGQEVTLKLPLFRGVVRSSLEVVYASM